MRAWGYCRVSSAGQATEGVSLDAQRARIEAWCAARGA
jgi:DNA invertase Pin-like site-specific DNA recombinase